MFVLPYAKKLFTLGVILLTAGTVVIGFLLLFPQAETVYQATVGVTTTGWFYSDKFRAEKGFWLELDISSTGPSILHVSGQAVGEIYNVEGSTYKYNIRIPAGDVYQVQVENKAGHSEWFGFVWVADENTFTGAFDLKRTPAYIPQLYLFSLVMLAAGALVVPTIIYMEYRERKRAKSVYECPRCKREVNIGLETCPYCKLDLTKYWVRCQYCKKLYDSHYDECPRCGSPTED
jgi:RNA polymerase subunit RPABC4/transcription elongation factor Spt4